MRRRIRRLRWLLTFFGVLCASSAAAYEAEVDASADAQFYFVRSPYAAPILNRQRYTHTLGLSIYDIGGASQAQGTDLSFRSRLRLDADFGVEDREFNPRAESRFVPGLKQAPLDLMYAYLEGRGYFEGLVGFRLGRQYVVDALGWWSFDGALLELTTPISLRVQAYGGFEQRVGLPALSTERFESDGVYRGNRDELELNQRPEFLDESKLAPAYGIAVESAPVHWVSGRVSYRRVIQSDRVNVSPFADTGGGLVFIDGTRISSDRLGYAMRADEPSIGGVRGEIVYDLYNQLFSEHALGLDWYTTEWFTVGADYEYYLPTYDADSIFNWFTHSGTTSLLGRVELLISERMAATVSGGVRGYRTEGEPETFAAEPNRDDGGTLLDYVGALRGRYRWSDGSVAFDGLSETGERGHRFGADVTTRQALGGGFYDTLLIVSLHDWKDSLRSQRDATSFTYVLGGGLRPGGSFFSRSRLGVEWEHTMNRLVGQRFRVLATLDLSLLTPVVP